MDVKANKGFFDKKECLDRAAGDIFEVDAARFKELNSTQLGELVVKVETLAPKKPKKEPASSDKKPDEGSKEPDSEKDAESSAADQSSDNPDATESGDEEGKPDHEEVAGETDASAESKAEVAPAPKIEAKATTKKATVKK